MNTNEIEVLQDTKNVDSKNNNTLGLMMLILFVISIINFGIYMSNSINASMNLQWNDVATESTNNNSSVNSQHQKYEEANLHLEKYGDIEKTFSFVTSALGLILLMIAKAYKQKIGLFVLIITLMIIGTCIMVL